MKKNLILILTLAMGLASCTSEKVLKDQMTKVLKENPDIMLKVIEENPADFVETFQKAIEKAKDELERRARQKQEEKFKEAFDNPLEASIPSDQPIRGNKDAELTLVEYSDFRCYYCSVGYKTVMQLLEKYKGNIRFIYKHMPFQGPIAVKAAQYYEAVRIQSEEKAWKFHDEVFENQRSLQKGEGYLKSVVKKLGLNMSKLNKDIASKEVMDKILADKEEGQKFEFQGTPGFLLNGVPIRGARDIAYFENIIAELKKRGKVKL